jgi:hypothetical protein
MEIFVGGDVGICIIGFKEITTFFHVLHGESGK